MLNNIIKIFVLIATISSLPSCVEKIDLDPPSNLTEAIVIQGRAVLGEPSRVEMQVSRLFDFSADSRLALNVKDVIFRDDQGNSMTLEPVNQGEYNTIIDAASPVQLEVGRSYGLELSTFDGRSYTSELDILTENNSVQDVSFGLAEEFVENTIGDLESVNRLETFVDTELADGSNGLLWELQSTYRLTDSPINGSDPKTCYITTNVTVNKLPVINLDNLTSGLLQKQSLVRQPIDFRMAQGMNLRIRQFSLSEAAAKYWESSSIIVEREGDLFDDPVGLIPSNFSNPNDANDEVFGFFFATKEVTEVAKVPVSLVGEIGNLCPPPPRPMQGSGCNLGICCDCLAAPISSLKRPDFWIE